MKAALITLMKRIARLVLFNLALGWCGYHICHVAYDAAEHGIPENEVFQLMVVLPVALAFIFNLVICICKTGLEIAERRKSTISDAVPDSEPQKCESDN